MPTAPAASLIKGVADSHRLQKLTMDAYGVLQSLRASEIRADASQWFSEADYRSCWEVDNLKHYYQRSASSFSNLPAKCARPLLEAIINETDSLFSARKNERIAETTETNRSIIPTRGKDGFISDMPRPSSPSSH